VKLGLELERPRILPGIIALGILISIVAVVFDGSGLWVEPAGIGEPVTPVIGEMFFEEFLSVFEIVAVLLVASLLGAVYLAKPYEEKREAVRRAVEGKPRVNAKKAEESMGKNTKTDTDENNGGEK